MPAVPTRNKKSEATRAAILDSARAAFREHGYEAANVRMIAGAAGIDPAMVIRYYGSKEGLFLAAVDVDLDLPDLAQVPKSRRGRVLVEHFVSRWEGSSDDDALITLLRSAPTNEVAADRVRHVFISQVKATITVVVPGGEAERRAALVATELLGLAFARYILRLPGISRQSQQSIIRDHGPSVQRHLGGSLPSD